MKAVTELRDLVFLDVQMPKLDGFEVLELLGRAVPVIFTTAYDKYALRAFDVHAVDYLLKPFSEERLAEALTRARGRIANRDGRRQERPAPDSTSTPWLRARPRQGPLERVLIRDGAQAYAPRRPHRFCRGPGRLRQLRRRRAFVSQGPDDGGGRGVARSGAVRADSPVGLLNIERIARVELYEADSRIAILRDGRKLPVSRAGYQRLAKLL